MSPGFTNELFNEGSGRFKVSFWIKNKNAEYVIELSAVGPKTGSEEITIRSNTELSEWTKIEKNIDVPDGNWLRIQLNITQPGTFWIDEIQIERNLTN